MNDILESAIRELKRRKTATFGNISGYAVCCIFITIVALMLQFDMQAKDNVVRLMGAKFLIYAPQKLNEPAPEKVALDPTSEGFFTEPAIVTKLMPVTVVNSIKKVPEVEAVTPFLLFRMKQSQDGHVFSLGGIKIENAEDEWALRSTMVSKYDIVKGTFFNPGDRNVVVLDKSYADMWNLKPGSYVNIADALYPVIGVVTSEARTARADIYMNWKDAEFAINKRISKPLLNEANIFLVASKSGEVNSIAMKKAQEILRTTEDLKASAVNCAVHAKDFMGISRSTLKYVLAVACLLVLLFSGNAQWSAVSERRHDIAILKCIGWDNSTIYKQIIAESVIAGAIGCIIGIIAGILLFPYAAFMVGARTSPDYFVLNIPLICLSILLGILVMATISGLISARAAVSEHPAKVLRQ